MSEILEKTPAKAAKAAKAGPNAGTDGPAIFLPAIMIARLRLTLVGDTPLIMHQWSLKAREAMLDKQMKKATPGKEAKDPERDYLDSIYRLPDGSPGFPVIAFKAAAVTACTSVANVTKVAARQAFHVDGELAKVYGDHKMREDMVRIAMGTADIRHRAEFPWWAVQLEVTYNRAMLSAEMLTNLFSTAGFAVGVGEWRPERDGQFGRFHVAEEAEVIRLVAEGKVPG